MSKFSLHEIAVGQNFSVNTQFNGVDIEIVGLLDTYPTNKGPGYGYLTRPANSMDVGVIHPRNLRKKKPPQEELKTWEQLKKDLGMSEETVHV